MALAGEQPVAQHRGSLRLELLGWRRGCRSGSRFAACGLPRGVFVADYEIGAA